ncbi:flagellar filament capping protein FliD [Shewanella inventionis]|uniref:Flagellar hook-associated protein 2 n=1 Tax=Shewanella inventionis TaxID=1738770 RepID=A0ABQ1IRJ3_9GAMM|nr:flagellar filament capping protein FliD [Shewanella inventionis]MCL1156722.1 flagellar filament capping protein FliD [Shewanella inventionis]GGB50168.1 flagellar hook-associated protein 2 [Shewanella inventionis]
MALTSVGIGSGIDISGIVTALVDAESAGKIAQFDANEGTITAKISGIGALKSAMSEFQTKLEALTEADTFGSQKVAVSTKDYLSATVDETAVSGNYQVKVEQLAQSQKVSTAVVADNATTIGTGSLAIAVGSNSFNIDVEATDTLTEIMNKINSSDDNDDVTATIINGELGPQLVLGSKTTGLDSTISVTATDSDGNTGLADTFTMTEVTPAKNAIVYIDGVKVVSQENTIEEGITGVSLTLTAADIDKTTTLTVSKDTAKTKAAIEGFVTAYNSVMTTIKDLSSYDADTEQAGILQGDSLPRSIQSQMRNMLSSQYSTSDGDKMLANLGITTTTAGLLEVDSTKLTEAIANDTGAIAEMFSTEDTGLASRMSSLMDSYVDSGGVLDSRDSSLDDQLSRLTDSREALATRMAAYSDRLYAQYNAMDLIVASLNSTSSDLQSRLDSLPGLVNNN